MFISEHIRCFYLGVSDLSKSAELENIKYYYEKPTNSPTQGQNKTRLEKKWHFGHFFPTAKWFYVGRDWFYIGNRLQETQPNRTPHKTPYVFNQFLHKHPIFSPSTDLCTQKNRNIVQTFAMIFRRTAAAVSYAYSRRECKDHLMLISEYKRCFYSRTGVCGNVRRVLPRFILCLKNIASFLFWTRFRRDWLS